MEKSHDSTCLNACYRISLWIVPCLEFTIKHSGPSAFRMCFSLVHMCLYVNAAQLNHPTTRQYAQLHHVGGLKGMGIYRHSTNDFTKITSQPAGSSNLGRWLLRVERRQVVEAATNPAHQGRHRSGLSVSHDTSQRCKANHARWSSTKDVSPTWTRR